MLKLLEKTLMGYYDYALYPCAEPHYEYGPQGYLWQCVEHHEVWIKYSGETFAPPEEYGDKRAQYCAQDEAYYSLIKSYAYMVEQLVAAVQPGYGAYYP